MKKTSYYSLLVFFSLLYLLFSYDFLDRDLGFYDSNQTSSDTETKSPLNREQSRRMDKKPRGILPGEFKDGLAPFYNGEKWGYVNKNGEWELPPQYQAALPFSNNWARVKKDDQWGYINRKGKWTIPPEFEFSYREGYSQNIATVTKNDSWGHLDQNGDTIVPVKYDRVSEFSEGLAWVQKDGKKGFVNKEGEIVIPLNYRDVRKLENGLAAANTNGKWGYLSKQGDWRIQPRYKWAKQFKEKRAPVLLGKKWGYINRSGKMIVDPNFEFAGSFHGGRALVQKKGRFGYINRNGKFIVEPKYVAAGHFSEGRARVFTGDGWGFINASGDTVITPKYDAITNFSDGWASVYAEKNWSFINKKGSTTSTGVLTHQKHKFRNSFTRQLALLRTLKAILPWYNSGSQYYHLRTDTSPVFPSKQHWSLGRFPEHGSPGGYRVSKFPYEIASGLQHEAAENLLRLTRERISKKQLTHFSEKPYHYHKKENPGPVPYYLSQTYMNDDFFLNPKRPEILNYYPTPKGPKLAGVFYTGKDFNRAPQIGGPLTPWQYVIYPNSIIDRCRRGQNLYIVSKRRCDDLRPLRYTPMVLPVFLVDNSDSPFGKVPHPNDSFLKKLMTRGLLNTEELIISMTCRQCL